MSSLIELYVGAIWGLRVLNSAWVASHVLYWCDYLDTFRREVAYIWPGKMNLGKVLFLVARYTTFFDSLVYAFGNGQLFRPGLSLSKQTCQAINVITAVSSLFGIATSCGLLTVSIYAILGTMKRQKMVLMVLSVSLYIVIFTLVGLYAAELFNITLASHPELGCLTSRNPSSNYIFLCYCLLLAGEASLTAMVVYLGIRKYLTQRNPLLNIMYEDGSLYFVATLSTTTLNIILLTTVTNPYVGGMFSSIQRVLHPIFANRLLLDMREHEALALEGRLNVVGGDIELSKGQEVLSDIRFGDSAPKEETSVNIA